MPSILSDSVDASSMQKMSGDAKAECALGVGDVLRWTRSQYVLRDEVSILLLRCRHNIVLCMFNHTLCAVEWELTTCKVIRYRAQQTQSVQREEEGDKDQERGDRWVQLNNDFR